MIRGVVIAVGSDGSVLTTREVDYFLATYKAEAREIRRRLAQRIDLDKVIELVALEERIEFWRQKKRSAAAA